METLLRLLLLVNETELIVEIVESVNDRIVLREELVVLISSGCGAVYCIAFR